MGATVKAQTRALLAKSAVYQRRNTATNLCLIIAPVFFCVLLAGLQALANHLILRQPNNQCGCRCLSCCVPKRVELPYTAEEQARVDAGEQVPRRYTRTEQCAPLSAGWCERLARNATCRQYDKTTCSLRYSSPSQSVYCPITTPSSWPPVMQTPRLAVRAGGTTAQWLPYTGSDMDAARRMAGNMFDSPELPNLQAVMDVLRMSPLALLNLRPSALVQLVLPLLGPGGLVSADGLAVGAAQLSRLELNFGSSLKSNNDYYLENAFVNSNNAASRLQFLLPEGGCEASGLSADLAPFTSDGGGVPLPELLLRYYNATHPALMRPLLRLLNITSAEKLMSGLSDTPVGNISTSCVDLVAREANSTAVLNKRLYCGFGAARCDGTYFTREYGGAWDFKQLGPTTLAYDTYYNLSLPLPDSPVTYRLPQLLNMATRGWTRSYWGNLPITRSVRNRLMGVQSFPKLPTVIKLDFSVLLGPLFYTWVIQMLMPSLLQQLVYEKEKRLRMMMKMHGLGDGAYWLVTYLWYLMLYILYMAFFIFFGSVIRLKIFTTNSYSLQAVTYFIFGNNMIAFMFLLSSLFTSSRTATIAAFLYVFATGLIGELMLRTLMQERKGYLAAVELVPGFALYRGLFEFSEYSIRSILGDSGGLTWAQLGEPGNGLRGAWALLAAEWPVFMLLGWYLEQVVGSGTGMRRHPLFFIRWMWRQKPCVGKAEAPAAAAAPIPSFTSAAAAAAADLSRGSTVKVGASATSSAAGSPNAGSAGGSSTAAVATIATAATAGQKEGLAAPLDAVLRANSGSAATGDRIPAAADVAEVSSPPALENGNGADVTTDTTTTAKAVAPLESVVVRGPGPLAEATEDDGAADFQPPEPGHPGGDGGVGDHVALQTVAVVGTSASGSGGGGPGSSGGAAVSPSGISVISSQRYGSGTTPPSPESPILQRSRSSEANNDFPRDGEGSTASSSSSTSSNETRVKVHPEPSPSMATVAATSEGMLPQAAVMLASATRVYGNGLEPVVPSSPSSAASAATLPRPSVGGGGGSGGGAAAVDGDGCIPLGDTAAAASPCTTPPEVITVEASTRKGDSSASTRSSGSNDKNGRANTTVSASSIGLVLNTEDPPDVAAEAARVAAMDDAALAATPIVVQGLRKEFKAYGGEGGRFCDGCLDWLLCKGSSKRLAVRDLTLAIERGECFGLLGPNGAGKTTAINMLTGFLEPTAGDAAVEGLSVRTRMPEIYSLMGVCPQHDLLWEQLTGEEHLRFYGRLKGLSGPALEEAVAAALRSVKLHLNDAGKRRVSGYSGGMKRRLSVAISFIGQPQVVYLDEPSTGLDPASRRALWDTVRKHKDGRAIILTTHSMEEAEVLCDRLGIFVGGRLVCIGNPREITSRYAGYLVFTITVGPGHEDAAQAFVKRMSPHARLTYALGGTFKYELPTSDVSLAGVFDAMASAKGLMQVLDWGVANATLEEVFIKFARQIGAETKDQ
ncbi:hypothetical protein Agub_g3550 [Astrephomene gubernaculifera]|uniref:ABC transporter domain-containing protein n=1 Tax=Astrephomene gubernaculifera TaxID=47775 RepID=A0AAD3HIJ3_9CHLO|nr:hypothetical protein Agub_g3550 [Astrephomene gubernaculifera]